MASCVGRMLGVLQWRALLLPLLLAGCVNVGKTPPPPRSVFDLGPPVAAFESVASGGALSLDMRGAPWVDQVAQTYRLAYGNVQQVREYAQTRWAGAPSQLVAQRLRQRLGWSDTGGRCTVLAQLEAFTQVFDSPGQSRGVLRVMLRIVDRKGAELAANHFQLEALAPTADAPGGVIALTAATDQVARSVGDWLSQPVQVAALRDCRGPR